MLESTPWGNTTIFTVKLFEVWRVSQKLAVNLKQITVLAPVLSLAKPRWSCVFSVCVCISVGDISNHDTPSFAWVCQTDPPLSLLYAFLLARVRQCWSVCACISSARVKSGQLSRPSGSANKRSSVVRKTLHLRTAPPRSLFSFSRRDWNTQWLRSGFNEPASASVCRFFYPVSSGWQKSVVWMYAL